jgi:endogenous inhibitor of DNA gyrase (YacG/DUF329 family)
MIWRPANDNLRQPGRKTHPIRLCPICGRQRVEPYRSFCSKRCADVDLHRWLVGGYFVPDASEDRDVPAENQERE